MLNPEFLLDNAKSAVTQAITRVATATETERPNCVQELNEAVDQLNEAWIRIKTTLTTQKEEKAREIDFLNAKLHRLSTKTKE